MDAGAGAIAEGPIPRPCGALLRDLDASVFYVFRLSGGFSFCLWLLTPWVLDAWSKGLSFFCPPPVTRAAWLFSPLPLSPAPLGVRLPSRINWPLVPKGEGGLFVFLCFPRCFLRGRPAFLFVRWEKGGSLSFSFFYISFFFLLSLGG